MAEFQFKLPDVGEGMHEGEIVKWLIKAGDSIEEDQIILEIQNDKSLVELPSPITGKVSEIKVTEGTVATVGQLLATFEVEEGKGNAVTSAVEKQSVAGHISEDTKSKDVQAETAETEQTAPTQATAAAVDPPAKDPDPGQDPDKTVNHSTILATPSIRKLARDHKVTLKQIIGTGRSGQITKEDVLSFLDNTPEQVKPPKPPTPPEQPEQTAALAAPLSTASTTQTAIGGRIEERFPLKGIRKIIANAMVKSVYTAPHVTLMDEVEVSKLIEFREKAKLIAEQKGIKLTYLPFIVKALVAAAKQFPIINSTLDELTNEIVYKKYYHVGIATDTDNGLIVPVITDANYKSLFSIASEIKDLAERGRNGKLALAELKGSTITITNIGSAGGMFFTPVINFPEVAILGTGKISQKPIVKNGEIVIGQVMALSLSFDHRIIDGATAQYAMNYVKQLLEDPQLLLMEG